MWTKIYFVLFAAALAAMCVLTFLCYWQLQSNGFAPKVIEESFLSYRNIFWQFLWISSLILLAGANVLLWLQRRAWAVWTTFFFFAVFVLVQSWWLGGMYFQFAKENNLTENNFSFSGILGAMLCAAVAVGAFFDHFLVLRMRDRVHSSPEQQQIASEGMIVADDAGKEPKLSEENI